MELTKEDLQIAQKALEVSAWQIYTPKWKARIQDVLSALRAGLTPKKEELDFALTVTYEGRLNYDNIPSGDAWDSLLGALPVRDKLRAA
jgi:hypothetical protein